MLLAKTKAKIGLEDLQREKLGALFSSTLTTEPKNRSRDLDQLLGYLTIER